MAGTGATLLAFDRWRAKEQKRLREGRPAPRSPFIEAALGYDHLAPGALARKPQPGKQAADGGDKRSGAGRPESPNSALSPARPASRAELMDPEFWREQREREAEE